MEKNVNKNPYEILNVPRNCSVETVRNRFRKLALLYHPDKSKLHSERKKKEETEEENQNIIEERNEDLAKEDINFTTILWAYEYILNEIKDINKKKAYMNEFRHALKIRIDDLHFIGDDKDLEFVKEEGDYVYICRCGDYIVFGLILYDEYFIIRPCPSCSSMVYLVPNTYF